jgi:hypothetical protein
VGGIAILAGLALLLFCLRRRRRSFRYVYKVDIDGTSDNVYTPEVEPKPLPLASTIAMPLVNGQHAQVLGLAPTRTTPSDASRALSSTTVVGSSVVPVSTSHLLSAVTAMVATAQPVSAKSRARRAELERQVDTTRAALINSTAHPTQSSSSEGAASRDNCLDHEIHTLAVDEWTSQRRIQELETELQELRVRTASTAPPAYASSTVDAQPLIPALTLKPVYPS